MPKYYKRGALGRMVEAEGGSSDPELAEVRMTEEEYHGLWDRIRRAERSVETTKAEAKAKIDEAWRQANRELNAAKQDAEAEAKRRISIAQKSAAVSAEEASSLREQLAQAEADLQNEKNLHRNMMRIMKERANQARGIKPKKGHDGYVVLESRQWTERYTEEVWDTQDHKDRYDNPENRAYALKHGYLRLDHKTAEVWKSVVQTPYNSSLPIKQVRERIEDEIGGVLEDINVASRLKPEYNGTYYDFGTNKDGYEVNGMYRWKYKANYRAGLWELEIFTTKSLRVPEHRRPPQRIKGRDRKPKKAAGAEGLYADDSDLDHTWYPDASELFGDFEDD